jgi:hypothetical protein
VAPLWTPRPSKKKNPKTKKNKTHGGAPPPKKNKHSITSMSWDTVPTTLQKSTSKATLEFCYYYGLLTEQKISWSTWHQHIHRVRGPIPEILSVAHMRTTVRYCKQEICECQQGTSERQDRHHIDILPTTMKDQTWSNVLSTCHTHYVMHICGRTMTVKERQDLEDTNAICVHIHDPTSTNLDILMMWLYPWRIQVLLSEDGGKCDYSEDGKTWAHSSKGTQECAYVIVTRPELTQNATQLKRIVSDYEEKNGRVYPDRIHVEDELLYRVHAAFDASKQYGWFEKSTWRGTPFTPTDQVTLLVKPWRPTNLRIWTQRADGTTYKNRPALLQAYDVPDRGALSFFATSTSPSDPWLVSKTQVETLDTFYRYVDGRKKTKTRALQQENENVYLVEFRDWSADAVKKSVAKPGQTVQCVIQWICYQNNNGFDLYEWDQGVWRSVQDRSKDTSQMPTWTDQEVLIAYGRQRQG